MTPAEALDFIQVTSWKGSRLGLERMTDLMHRLGDPQRELKFIHIAGTNGKGSSAAMLAAILTAAGYRTGLYTSPHLRSFHERMKINGADINDGELCDLAEQVRPAVDAMEDSPTEFERVTAMAFLYFRQKRCDFVVLEVGLGGRLDATNVIPAPEVAAITNIGLEHTEVLGDTLEQIAAEKAGIIKPGSSVVLYQQSAEVEAVVRAKCAACGDELCVTDAAREHLLSGDLEGQTLSYRARERLRLGLLGTYQYKNAAVVLDSVDALIRRGAAIPERAVRAGLAAVRWPGRFEVLQSDPLVLVDGAHNPNGVEELIRCLRQYLPGRTMTFVMGVMADKNYGAMLDRIAPFARRLITVTPESRRSLPSKALETEIRQRLGLPVRDAGTVQNGVALALRESGPDDIVCVFGSLYQVGEVRACFGK